MKYFFIILIRLYWLIPSNLRSKCLYKESCSNYVFRIAQTEGFKRGIEAFKYRYKCCRPYYKILDIDQDRIVICENGDVINETELAHWLRRNE